MTHFSSVLSETQLSNRGLFEAESKTGTSLRLLQVICLALIPSTALSYKAVFLQL